MMGVSRWKIGLVVVATFLGLLFSLPNFLPENVLRSVPFLPQQTLNLGLDLRGGSSLKMEVDQEALLAQEANDLVENTRTTLREAGIAFTNLTATGDTVTFRVTDSARVSDAVNTITRMTAPVQAGVPAQVAISRQNDQVVSVRLTQDYLNYALAEAVSSSIEVIRKRIDAMGNKEVTIIRQGSARIMVEAPGESDPEALKRVIGQTARLTFQMVDDSVSESDIAAGRIPPGSEVLPFADGQGTIVVRRRVVVSGDHLTGAYVEADQNGRPAIGFQFNADGARRFGDTTIHNQGKLFAIILDGQVMSAPRIQSPITGGRGQITGNFTAVSATELVNVLKGGSLKVPLRFEEQRTVGAELGADAVAKGEISTAVAFVLVLVFMLLAYGLLFGGISIVALIVNLLLLVGGMSLMQSTLTLPGIAGLILTLAMAVDANVIIYERMRDEARNGKPVINALDSGFSRAMETIIDANVTTLVAAAIMYFLGAGPVRGFAVTLMLGLFTSVFSAVLITQVLLAWWYKTRRPKTLPIADNVTPKRWPWIKLLPQKTGFKFVKYAKAAGFISVVLAIGSLVLTAVPFQLPCGGLNCGIDFKGGSSLDMRLPGQQLDLGLLRDRLGDAGLNGVQVQAIENGTGAAIRFETPEGQNATARVDEVKAELLKDFPNASFGRTEVVGAKVSGELLTSGLSALLIAIFLMMVYIWFRFEWQFGLGAVIGLFHDVILTFGLFALFKLQFDLNAVAALLTIIGYSMNDTVVVFDRLRENLRKFKKMPLDELIDLTINETLSRTIMTGVTAIMALVVLALLGGEALFAFSVSMIFGIIVGTYSSVYVAAPAIMIWGVNRNQGEAEVVDVGGFKGNKPNQVPRP